ncbi:MAG: hypothetical protein LBQ79_06430 [Deltaproteobacteria bacterium]|nr:hypothetical protein [Deltaproteobacteria bacterium]
MRDFFSKSGFSKSGQALDGLGQLMADVLDQERECSEELDALAGCVESGIGRADGGFRLLMSLIEDVKLSSSMMRGHLEALWSSSDTDAWLEALKDHVDDLELTGDELFAALRERGGVCAAGANAWFGKASEAVGDAAADGIGASGGFGTDAGSCACGDGGNAPEFGMDEGKEAGLAGRPAGIAGERAGAAGERAGAAGESVGRRRAAGPAGRPIRGGGDDA